MEEMELEKSLTIEDFRLWSLKIKKKPSTGSGETKLLFFLVLFSCATNKPAVSFL